MTTRDFIARTYNTTSTRERHCSSVFTDTDGNVYSYGYHYPLAFRVGGLDFINVRGYSNTTSKHIAWAWQAVGYDAIPVELSRDDRVQYLDLNTLVSRLHEQLGKILDQMVSKKRKDTQVYRALQHEHEQVYNYIKQVEEVRA